MPETPSTPMPETHSHKWTITQTDVPDFSNRIETGTPGQPGYSVSMGAIDYIWLDCECGEHISHPGTIVDIRGSRGKRWSIDRFISHETVQRVLMRRRHPANRPEGE